MRTDALEPHSNERLIVIITALMIILENNTISNKNYV